MSALRNSLLHFPTPPNLVPTTFDHSFSPSLTYLDDTISPLTYTSFAPSLPPPAHSYTVGNGVTGALHSLLSRGTAAAWSRLQEAAAAAYGNESLDFGPDLEAGAGADTEAVCDARLLDPRPGPDRELEQEPEAISDSDIPTLSPYSDTHTEDEAIDVGAREEENNISPLSLVRFPSFVSAIAESKHERERERCRYRYTSYYYYNNYSVRPKWYQTETTREWLALGLVSVVFWGLMGFVVLAGRAAGAAAGEGAVAVEGTPWEMM